MAKLTNIDAQIQPFFAIRSIDQFLPNVIQLVLILGSIATLFYLFWGGISFITAAGDKEAVKTAREKITHAVLGLAILAAVWVLWRAIVYFLGLSSSVTGPFKINVPAP